MIKLNIIKNRGMGKERRTGNDHSVTGELSEERKEGELRNGACLLASSSASYTFDTGDKRLKGERGDGTDICVCNVVTYC